MVDNELLLAISDLLDKKLEPVQNDIHELKQDVAELKQDVAILKQEVAILKQDVAVLKQDVAELNRRMTSLELTLENETNKNIMRVAEGHLDLSRQLDDALKIENEKEMLALRVNILENELRKVKEQIAILAKAKAGGEAHGL